MFKQMSALPFAPSVQMHEVPEESVAEHLGLPSMRATNTDHESEELDKNLGSESVTNILMHLIDDVHS